MRSAGNPAYEDDGDRGSEGSAGDLRDVLWGAQREAIERRLAALDPDLAAYVSGFAYGTVYSRGILDLKTQELLAVAMLMALGNPAEITTHLRGALRAGASEQEVREVIIFAVPYLGFPRAVGAMQALKELLGR